MKLLTGKFGALNFLLCGTLLVGFTPSAFAVLGDNAASVLTDQARMKGTLQSVDNTTYVLHEITMSSGAKVREFVTPGGAVFGVAWEGQFPPDLQALLGAYYQQAQQAVAQQKADEASQNQPRRRGPIVVQTSSFVLVEGGRNRSHHGLAYVPQLIPQGVETSQIR
jgi:hypothetical protein